MKSILSDLAIYTTAEATSKILIYSLTFIAAVLLSRDEYGLFSLLLGIQLLLTSILELGQGTVLFQLYFDFAQAGRLKVEGRRVIIA